MHLIWREGIHACELRGRWILLDLRTGRYGAITSDAVAALRKLVTGDTLEATERLDVLPLIREGTLLPSATRDLSADRPLARPCTQGPHGSVGPVAWLDFGMAVMAQVAARMLLRVIGFGGIHRLFSASSGGERRSREEAASTAARISRALARTELLFSRRDACLRRSIAFRLLAAASGVRVRLVIGVQAAPFAAHCWIERDGAVLNDELDVVVGFTPLLAV